jgi:aminopeptidase N
MPSTVRQLSNLFKVSNYKLDFDLTKSHQRQFSGTVQITGELPKSSKSIVIHSKDLVITKVLVDDSPAEFTHGAHDELEILGDFKQGAQTIKISFNGKMTDTLEGIYNCPYKYKGQEKQVLGTQFESHAARQAFPCLDEPAAKASFDLTLKTQKDLTVLSNMPVKKQHSGNKFLVTHFKQTPKISTYLLAFAAGELGFTETTSSHGVKVRAYSTLEHVAETEFVLNIAAKFLDYFNDYFGVPYPLAKCDLLALPDFSAGAMENWGLITFRESCMFVSPETSIATKQFNAMVVGHELAHQWFGNLVTMQWWDDLWLNESFANWMG